MMRASMLRKPGLSRSDKAVRRHRRRIVPWHRWRDWRSGIGLAAAMVALATQMTLSLLPMPDAPSPASRSLASVAALWGLSSLCLPSDAPGKPGAHADPFAGHGCPICQVVHQALAFVPPHLLALDLPAQATDLLLPRPPDTRAPRPAFSTPRSRAPPTLA
jgi:hypothetical protein